MKKKFVITAILSLVLLGATWCFSAAEAQRGLLPETGYETGSYTLDDFVRLALIISKWILGIVGSLTLVMFIYGGVLLLISGGSSEKIDKAKKAMVAAVIGLAIVLGSSLIIKTSMEYIGLAWDGSTKTPTPIEK